MKNINLIIQEIEKHLEQLKYTKEKIKKLELDPELISNPEIIEIIDSFIFRFAKMQDTMGEKLFPLILQILGENVRNKPFIDILNKLEQLEFIPSSNEWKKLREIRNRITHTYPWQKDELIFEIKESLKYSDKMIETYQNIKEKLKKYVKLEN